MRSSSQFCLPSVPNAEILLQLVAAGGIERPVLDVLVTALPCSISDNTLARCIAKTKLARVAHVLLGAGSDS